MVVSKRALEANQRPENQGKAPNEKELRPVLCLPDKWWHGRVHWKKVSDQKTRWKTPRGVETRALFT
jgi:hypothetical protein